MKSNSFFKVLIGIAAAGALVGLALRGKSSVEAIEASWTQDQVLSRKVSERTLKPATYQQVYSLGGAHSEPGGLLNPLVIRADSLDNVYVIDFGDFKIKKVSPNGDIVATFGNGRGQGPGELNNPTDLAIGKDGDLWVCDPPNGSITIFAQDGTIKETIRLKSRPFRLLLRPDGGFIVRPENPAAGLIEEYDSKHHLVRQYGHLFSRQEEISIALDGWIAMSPNNDLLFAPLRFGILAAFRDGRSRYIAETLEDIPMPKVETSPNGMKRVDPKAPVVQLSISAVESSIFLHTVHRLASGKYHSYLDVYDLDGNYLHSFEAPDSGQSLVVTAGSVFSLNKGSLSRFLRSAATS